MVADVAPCETAAVMSKATMRKLRDNVVNNGRLGSNFMKILTPILKLKEINGQSSEIISNRI
jgi:hypothetical protein